VETLVDAYRHGIFPWPLSDGITYWWSPDPRALFPLDGVRVSRSLRRTLRSGRYRCTVDTAFADVVCGCARTGGIDTWISPDLRDAYRRLHARGVAHSVEVWDTGDGALAGGLLGIAIGGLFTGESMFSARTDASKVGLVHLADRLRDRGFRLLDAQMPTEHLLSLGAVTVSRDAFLDALADAVDLAVAFR
jgi:leucyl/phenylalanyl-tRNA--protein transferase